MIRRLSEGTMVKVKKPNFVFSVILLFSFLCISAHAFSKDTGKGNMVGFIFAEDQTTPVPGAILKLRNVNTGNEYASDKTDDLGIFTLKDIEAGLYIVGISSQEGDFNFNKLVGIKSNETAKVSFSLVKEDKQAAKQPQTEEKKDKKSIASFFLSSTGIVLSTAATGATFVAIVSTAKKNKEASPFK